MVPRTTLIEGREDPSALEARIARLGLGSFVRVVGEGAMGAAVLVKGFPGAEGPVVVKVLRTALLGDVEAARRFRRELQFHARLWAQLQAPRLVPCLAVGDVGGAEGLFAVFPFYPDGNLADAAETLPLEDVLRCLADVAEGLGALHGHGYVHRDVCPKNLFVSREGGRVRGRLGDLGVAVPLGGNTFISHSAVDRELDLTVGHAGFIDPWHGGTGQGDLFGLGASLYALLTGAAPPRTPPPEGLRLPGIGQCRRDVSAELHRKAQEVLEHLTARDLERRYRSASEAMNAIQKLATVKPPRFLARTGGSRIIPWMAAGTAALILFGSGLVLRGQEETAGPRTVAATASERIGAVAVTSARNRAPVRSPVASRTPPVSRPTPGAVRAPEAAPRDEGTAEVETGCSRSSVIPPAGTATPVPDVSTLVSRAEARVRARHPGEAVPLLRRALAESPTDPEVTSLLALILSREPGGSPEAAGLLEAALERHPGRGDLRLQLSRLRAASGDLEMAVRIVDRAPAGSTFRGELAHWRVTLDTLRRRSVRKEADR